MLNLKKGKVDHIFSFESFHLPFIRPYNPWLISPGYFMPLTKPLIHWQRVTYFHRTLCFRSLVELVSNNVL